MDHGRNHPHGRRQPGDERGRHAGARTAPRAGVSSREELVLIPKRLDSLPSEPERQARVLLAWRSGSESARALKALGLGKRSMRFGMSTEKGGLMSLELVCQLYRTMQLIRQTEEELA